MIFNKNQKYLNSGISVLFLAAVFSVWLAFFSPANFNSKEKTIFEVGKGDTAKEISEHLKKEGLIKNEFLFRTYIFLRGSSRGLKAGIYEFFPSMSVYQIADKLAFTDVYKVALTIPEGFKTDQIEGLLKSKLKLKEQNPILYKKDYQFLKDAPDGANLEGYLFPDTYKFNYETTTEEVLKMMLDNFGRKIGPYQNEILSKGKTIFEVVTMASLIEKEVKTKEDKELVSGILWKRLELGMPLQVDATINYITGREDTGIPEEEFQIDSPYNTYKYRGLPAGPITNPGLESILAAMRQKDSQFLYYLSTPKGETIFNRTLEEHNAAKEKYLE